jgi:hypothetical protein
MANTIANRKTDWQKVLADWGGRTDWHDELVGIGNQLRDGATLSERDRRILVDLIRRLLDDRPAQRALGLSRRSKAAERTAEIAAKFVRLSEIQKVSREDAVNSMLDKCKQKYGYSESSIRKAIESKPALVAARFRLEVDDMIARDLATIAAPTNKKITGVTTTG